MKIPIQFNSWFSSLSDLVFPPICPGCKTPLLSDEEFTCLKCSINLPISPYLLQNDNPISTLFKGRLDLEFATSFLLFVKDGITQNLIHALKYKNRTDIGVRLGNQLGKKIKGKITLPDVIIPIPLHPKKEKIRGYNQCDFISKGIGQALDLKVDYALVSRIKENISQTKLARYQRWENVKDIFSCSEEHDYTYIWIVDDTLTTGSTLEACANAITKHKKNVKIGIITLAYAY